MADIANLVLAVDSTSVPKAVASLDGLTAAGARAEAATIGLGGGFKGAGAEATAMAAAAQLSARAAVDQAAGFGAATTAARVNTLALRESLVVAREISRGNFTRVPGSLTLLAQGIGSQGGIGAYASAIANQLGLIRQVQNAELAEAATAAATAAAGVEAAARKAGANILAADTEVALAEAQLRTAETATAEAAAQARLAAANEAVAAAAAEATIAENALAVAQGRAAETGAASAAATRTLIGGSGIGLLGIAAVAGIAFGAIKQFQDQVKDDGTLTDYRDKLGLTHAEMLKLSDGVDKVGGHIKQLGDVTVTFGDVFHGIWAEVSREANDEGPWSNLKNHAVSAFDTILSAWNKTSAGITAGLWTIQNLLAGGAGTALGLPVGAIPTVNGGQIDPRKNYAKALADNAAAFGGVKSGAINSAEDRMRAEADALKADRSPKRARKSREAVDHADDTIARLDEQILSAKIALTKDVTEEASLKVQQLRVERDKTIADAQSLLNTHKITQTEFDAIKYRAQQLDNLKEQAVLDQRDIKLMEQDQAIKDQLYGFQTDALKFADEMATNSADHRDIQLQMLDIAFKQKAADLQILEAKQQLAHDFAAAALTQNEINNLPQQQARAQALVIKNNADPLELWKRSVPQTARDITDAIKGIEVNGINSLAQGIAGVITGTESLGKAFKDIANQIIGDIIQMTVKMLIFKAISSIFGGGGFGGDFGGNSLQPISSGLLGSGSPLGSALTHLATGGPAMGGQTYLVGENGPELFRPSSSGTVIPNGHMAANNNQGGPIEVHILVDTSENLDTKIDTKIVGGMQQTFALSVDHTNRTIKSIARPKLNGGR